MTYDQLKQYAADLGVQWHQNIHDGGQTITLIGAKAEASYNIDWGEENRFYVHIKSWLDTQPWPTDDDPRVQNEGAYL